MEPYKFHPAKEKLMVKRQTGEKPLSLSLSLSLYISPLFFRRLLIRLMDRIMHAWSGGRAFVEISILLRGVEVPRKLNAARNRLKTGSTTPFHDPAKRKRTPRDRVSNSPSVSSSRRDFPIDARNFESNLSRLISIIRLT